MSFSITVVSKPVLGRNFPETFPAPRLRIDFQEKTVYIIYRFYRRKIVGQGAALKEQESRTAHTFRRLIYQAGAAVFYLVLPVLFLSGNGFSFFTSPLESSETVLKTAESNATDDGSCVFSVRNSGDTSCRRTTARKQNRTHSSNDSACIPQTPAAPAAVRIRKKYRFCHFHHITQQHAQNLFVRAGPGMDISDKI